MLETNLIKTIMCSYRSCDSPAVYEFTDLLLLNPEKKIGERELKQVVLANSCETHYNKIRNRYAK